MSNFEPVIGMEVHVELQTKSKMFCGCEVAFGGEPNTRCCPVCLGLPGSLPVVNETAIKYMTKAALALNCEITRETIFHRKNYYYPDLPKDYQISQYDFPLGTNGWVEIRTNGKTKKIAIRRVHMEEDTGKLLHVEGKKSHVDYNRSGVPLMEIVTMNPPPPGLDQIENGDEAREYLQRLRSILVYLNISDCKMEEGSMRCEPNISIKPVGQVEFGTKTEIKNLNSFRVVQLGVEYEIKRQERVITGGEKVVQETRRWDDSAGKTVAMRSKEFEQEYRYFPDPDLVPIHIEDSILNEIKASIPELPMDKIDRFVGSYGISETDAQIIADTPDIAKFYDECASAAGDPKTVCNWVVGELLRVLNATGKSFSESKISSEDLAGLLKLIEKGEINRNTAKTVFQEMFDTGKSPEKIVEEKGLKQVSDTSAVEEAVEKVLAANPDEVARYKGGEEKLVGFFVGQVMREMKGKANPQIVNEVLKSKLS